MGTMFNGSRAWPVRISPGAADAVHAFLPPLPLRWISKVFPDDIDAKRNYSAHRLEIQGLIFGDHDLIAFPMVFPACAEVENGCRDCAKFAKLDCIGFRLILEFVKRKCGGGSCGDERIGLDAG